MPPGDDANYQRLSFRLSTTMHAEAIELARRDDRTLESLIRLAVREYLQEHNHA